MLNTVSRVDNDSAAFDAGIIPGDTLLEINGRPIADVLDYMYYSYDADPSFLIQHKDGSREIIEQIGRAHV